MGTTICEPIRVQVAPKLFRVTVQAETTKVVSLVEQGPRGPAGTATTTVINISTPTTLWTLNHYLGRYPSVTLLDTTGQIIEACVKYLNNNVITVEFSAPFAGSAYLN